MLTDEDVKAHNRLIGKLNSMSIEALAEAYRVARRDYEPLLICGADAQEPEVRSEILACEIRYRRIMDHPHHPEAMIGGV